MQLSPGTEQAGKPLTTVSQTDGTAPDSTAYTGCAVDPDLRIRTPAHWLDAPH
jgi:hypothetical protein